MTQHIDATHRKFLRDKVVRAINMFMLQAKIPWRQAIVECAAEHNRRARMLHDDIVADEDVDDLMLRVGPPTLSDSDRPFLRQERSYAVSQSGPPFKKPLDADPATKDTG